MDHTHLIQTLNALHQSLPVSSPDRDHMYRTALIQAMEELTIAEYSKVSAGKLVKELEGLRKASKAQAAKIDELDAMLNPRPITQPVSAGQQQRGVADELQEG